MRKFLFQILLFSLIISFSIYYLFDQADGSSDPFYLRFTTPKQKSLIIGSSRSAQGIQPKILNSLISNLDIYNYSFTINNSPFGETYFSSIKRKLDTSFKNGVFIIEVNPWTISNEINESNLTEKFREKKLQLGKAKCINIKPNILYLLELYEFRYINIIKNKYRKGKIMNMFLHDDGWLEVTISMDSVQVNKRTKRKINKYNNYLKEIKYSSIRFQYLNKTISFLKEYGDVYLVRLPVHQKMIEIENRLIPNFNFQMNTLSVKNNIIYKDFNLLSEEFTFTDGNHLSKTSGLKISKIIANQILTDRKLKN